MASPGYQHESVNIQLLVDSIPALIHTSRPDGYLDYFNKPWLEYLGATLDKVTGWNWTAFIHPEDLDGIVDKWRGSLKTGEIFEYETRVRRADGEYRWMFHRKVPLYDAGGDIVKWYGSSLDIDERKTADEQLRRNAEELQRSEFHLAEGQRLAHLGSWAFDPEAFYYWSPELFRIHGLDPAGKAPSVQEYLDRVHPQDRESMANMIKRILEEAVPFDATKRIVRPDGQIRYIRCVGVPLVDNQNQKKYVGSAIDVTEHELLNQELRRREAYLAEAQRLSHTGSFGWSPDTGEIVWSDETYRIFEFDAAEKPTVNAVLQRAHPQDRARVQQDIENASRSGTDFEHEYRLLLQNGVMKHVHVRAQALRDSSGNVEFVGAVTDITERKAAEEALRSSEAYLAEAQRLSRTGSWAWSPDQDIRYWSEECYRVLSFDPQDGLPRFEDFFRRIHPDDQPGFREVIQTATRDKAEWEADYRIVHPGGAIRNVHVVAHPVLSASGHLVEFVGTVMDVTERELLTRELRRREAFLTEAQRLSHTGSFGWNPDSGELVWSDETYRIFEYDREVKPTPDLVLERVHPEDRASFQMVIARVSAGATQYEHSYRFLLPDGRVKHVRVIARVMEQITGSALFIGTVQDITESKLAEEALNKARSELAHVTRVTSLNALTASMAHEVNQPLAGIITNASTCLRMLQSDPPNIDGALETARRTIRDGNRASDVITRLRALFSKKEFALEPLDLNEAAREVIALSLGDLQRNRVILRSELAENLPPVIGDRVQLQQVILNLVRNASDAMTTVEDRPRELLIRTEEDYDTEKDYGDLVRLSVKDAGVGFTPEARDKLFEAFYTTKNDGMGIGLSVSRSIIDAHHGHLWAAPNDGPGATFSFSVPCRSAIAADSQTAVNPL